MRVGPVVGPVGMENKCSQPNCTPPGADYCTSGSTNTGGFTRYGQPVRRPDPTQEAGNTHFLLWGEDITCTIAVPFSPYHIDAFSSGHHNFDALSFSRITQLLNLVWQITAA